MNYEALEDKQFKGEWRVEAIFSGEGEVFVTIFSGPAAQGRAEEYARFKNAQLAAIPLGCVDYVDGDGIAYAQDGNMRVAVRASSFTNIMESSAGFGPTDKEARKDLLVQESKQAGD